MNDASKITIVAIIAIAALEALALYLGYDGALLAVVFTGIGAMAGFTFGTKKPEAAPLPAVIGFSIALDTSTLALIVGISGVLVVAWLAYRVSNLPGLIMKGLALAVMRVAKSTGTGDDAEAFQNLSSALERAWKGDEAALLSVATNPLTIKAAGQLRPIAENLLGKLGRGQTTKALTYAGGSD